VASNPSNDKPVPAPSRLVSAGRATHGWFAEAVRVPNLIDEEFGGLHGRKSLRRLRLKQWQFFLIDAPECLAGVAVVDAGYVGNTFAWVFDKRNRTLEERNVIYPFGGSIEVSTSSVRGTTRAEGKGVDLTITNRYEEGVRTIQGRFPARGTHGAIGFELRISDPPLERPPMVVCWPVAKNRSACTHKIGGLSVSGSVHVGDRVYAVPEGQGTAAMDHTQGFFPYHTYWNWASFSGLSDWGTRVAIDVDVVKGEGGDQNRNCFVWFDRQLVRLPGVAFTYSQPAHDWHLASTDGRLDLRFHPLAVRRDRLDHLPIGYDFSQPIGTFTGTLVDNDDVVHAIKDAYGVAEEHTARW
jgi:hypothetical protein